MTQFSSHTPESPSKLNSLWWSVLLSSQKWKISFAPRNLFNSRINNRALLLQRLLFIFCSCWRRLLLKDQLFICLFVESLLLLSLSIFPIIIFFVTVVAMITIFISSSFISASLFLLLVVFLFFFLFFFFFHFDSKDPMWVVWLLFLLTPKHCPFFVTWEILGVEMEDGRQSWKLTAERCTLLLNNSSGA